MARQGESGFAADSASGAENENDSRRVGHFSLLLQSIIDRLQTLALIDFTARRRDSEILRTSNAALVEVERAAMTGLSDAEQTQVRDLLRRATSTDLLAAAMLQLAAAGSLRSRLRRRLGRCR